MGCGAGGARHLALCMVVGRCRSGDTADTDGGVPACGREQSCLRAQEPLQRCPGVCTDMPGLSQIVVDPLQPRAAEAVEQSGRVTARGV